VEILNTMSPDLTADFFCISGVAGKVCERQLNLFCFSRDGNRRSLRFLGCIGGGSLSRRSSLPTRLKCDILGRVYVDTTIHIEADDAPQIAPFAVHCPYSSFAI